MKPYLESHHLNVFVTLARTLNMSAAAKELGLTPSAISHALKVLEADLGQRVFERSPQRMELLAPGQVLLSDAVAILQQLQALRTKVESGSGKPEDAIRLGAPFIVLPFFKQEILHRFQAHFPACNVQVAACDTATGVLGLAEGRLDLAIITEPPRNPGVDVLFLGEDELSLVVHPRHDWAVKSWVSFAEVRERLRNVPYCGGETLSWIQAVTPQDPAVASTLREVAREEALVGLLNQTIEGAILPRWLVAEQIECGQLTQLQLGRRTTSRRWLLATRKHHPLGSAESHLLGLCRANLRELLRG
jgi:DNA-binding transcriptional LysR family regulator